MARIAADNGIEVSLFVGPREEWDIGRAAASADGGGVLRPPARHPAAPVRGRGHPAGGRAGDPRLPHRRPRIAPARERDAGRRAAARLDRLEGLGRPRTVESARVPGARAPWRLDRQRAVGPDARPGRGDAGGQHAADRPVRRDAGRDGRRGPRPRDGRPDHRGGTHVRQVRPAQLPAALPERPAPDRGRRRHRQGEGPPRPDRDGVGGPQRAGPVASPSPVRPGLGVPEPAR